MKSYLVKFSVLLGVAGSLANLGASQVTPQSLRDTEARIQQLTEKALPATVSLIPGGESRRFGTGSGVVVTKDGLILTAAHVAVEMNEKVTVIFPNGSRAEAKVLGMDFSRDAAMVQITDGGEYPFVEMGSSKNLQRNDWCIALGHASGYQADRTPPIRLGRVIENDKDSFVMSDCALIGGDSGGPLFDLDGRLIGIHSNIGFSLSQNNHVPISTYLDDWGKLLSGDRYGGAHLGGFLDNPERPMLGVVLEDTATGGAAIRQVMPGSPAEKAGLEPGNVVLRIGTVAIRDTKGLIEEVGRYRAGNTLQVRIRSGAVEQDIEIKLTSAENISGLPPSGGPQLRRSPQGAERKPMTNRERRALQTEFNQLMRGFLKQGDFQIDREMVEKFGGSDELAGFMMRFGRTLNEQDQAKLVEMFGEKKVEPGKYDPDKPIFVGEGFFREVMNAFRPSVVTASDATHLVFRGQEWKSLCTIVHEDGYALTKASEIETKNNQALTVMLSKDEQAPARIVKSFPDYDLALIKIETDSQLMSVQWDQRERLPLGSLLAAAGSGPDPIAIGVVSVHPRSLSSRNKGFLGIGTAPHSQGIRVTQVLSGGNAGKAGIRAGDIITRVDAEVCDTPEKLIRAISSTKPGETVEIAFLRNQKEQKLNVKLGDRSEVDRGMPDRNHHMNQMGTELSDRRTEYPTALQTDLPIKPQECGGPLVDLDGNVIGINIARAGRIKTFALPADTIEKLVSKELKKLGVKKAAPAPI
ncbi:MAG: trypsin-like peptidase domain-containing protein [Verrucomicrobiota bacterium]